MSEKYTVGIDFGTLSRRALVVRVSDGFELASSEYLYPHGVMEKHLPDGTKLGPEWALQHPLDYLGVFQNAVPAALASSGVNPADVLGIGIDFTACTVLPTLEDGTPLCLLGEFAVRPHAWVKLWKHHAAQGQADRINALAHSRGESWISRYGGKISSEWAFPKALEVLEEDPVLFQATRRWIEAADWVVWRLCGVETRNPCTAHQQQAKAEGLVRLEGLLVAIMHPEDHRTRRGFQAFELQMLRAQRLVENPVRAQRPQRATLAAFQVTAHAAQRVQRVTERPLELGPGEARQQNRLEHPQGEG